MKVIIAGSRSITLTPEQIDEIVKESGFEVTELVCGMARGIDRSGKAWAQSRGIKVTEMPAHWKEHGQAAGFIRNRQMADYSDVLIAIWDLKSPGTRNMMACMQGWKPVFIKIPVPVEIPNPRMHAKIEGF